MLMKLSFKLYILRRKQCSNWGDAGGRSPLSFFWRFQCPPHLNKQRTLKMRPPLGIFTFERCIWILFSFIFIFYSKLQINGYFFPENGYR